MNPEKMKRSKRTKIKGPIPLTSGKYKRGEKMKETA
jgi:hypothetical protein